MEILLFIALLSASTSAKSIVKERVKRVIKGTPTAIESIPYQVALVVDNFPICGGTIIQNDIIITAAHCCCSYDPADMLIYAGMFSKRDLPDKKGIKVKSLKVHERYNYTGEATPDDLALIKLEEKLTFGPTIKKIELIDENYDVPVVATVSGWGSTNCNFSLSDDDACNGWYAVELQSGNVTVTRRENGLIYAPSTNVTANYGDSGGPVVVNRKLIGVSRNCDIVEPNVFNFDATSILDYLPWINKTLESLKIL